MYADEFGFLTADVGGCTLMNVDFLTADVGGCTRYGR